MNDKGNQCETLETMSMFELLRGSLSLDIPDFRDSCLAELMRRLDEDHPDVDKQLFTLGELYHLNDANRARRYLSLRKRMFRLYPDAKSYGEIIQDLGVVITGDDEHDLRRISAAVDAKYREKTRTGES
jgi:hypothetical protein